MRTLTLRSLAALALAGLVFSACGGDDDSADTTTAAEATTTAPLTTAPAGDTFPVTVTHKFGTTTVESEPERVVTVETGKEEYLLALDVVPVGAVRSTFANFADGLSPWAIEAIGDRAMPELFLNSDGINYEAVAALQPDLIVGTEGLTDADYAALSAIAPTIAQSADFDDYASPWQTQAALVGEALGRADEMAAVVADVEAKIDDTVTAHPDFAGKTAVFAGDFGDGQVYVFADYRNDLFERLGFTYPATLTDAVLAEAISGELLEALDADAVLMALYAGDGAASIADSPLLTGLPMSSEGRIALIPGTTPSLSAINFNTPLSLPVAIDQFVPVLEALIDADPATEPPALS